MLRDLSMGTRPPHPPLSPYTTLFRSLMQGGWKFSDVKPNQTITVILSPLRNGEPAGLLVRITLADGRILSNGDRKSTRLNSSHLVISYAVFCLKKKNIS